MDVKELENSQFDCVTAFEVLEHTLQQQEFLSELAGKAKPGGLVFLSTFDKTLLSWVFGVKLTENVLNIIPKGTHDWDKFVPYEHVESILKENKVEVLEKKGVGFNPVSNQVFFTEIEAVNYILVGRKI